MLQKAPMTSPSVLGTPQPPPHVRRRGSQRLEASLSYSASLLFCQPRSQALQAVLFFVLFSSPKPYSDHPQLESLITSMRLCLFPVIPENDSLDLLEHKGLASRTAYILVAHRIGLRETLYDFPNSNRSRLRHAPFSDSSTIHFCLLERKMS